MLRGMGPQGVLMANMLEQQAKNPMGGMPNMGSSPVAAPAPAFRLPPTQRATQEEPPSPPQGVTEENIGGTAPAPLGATSSATASGPATGESDYFAGMNPLEIAPTLNMLQSDDPAQQKAAIDILQKARTTSQQKGKQTPFEQFMASHPELAKDPNAVTKYEQAIKTGGVIKFQSIDEKGNPIDVAYQSGPDGMLRPLQFAGGGAGPAPGAPPPSSSAGGGTFSIPSPAGGRAASSIDIAHSLDQMQGMLNILPTKPGLPTVGGYITGTAKSLTGYPDESAFSSLSGALSDMIPRFFSGRSNQAAIANAQRTMVPNFHDTQASAKRKIETLRSYVEKGQLPELGEPGFPTSSFQPPVPPFQVMNGSDGKPRWLKGKDGTYFTQSAKDGRYYRLDMNTMSYEPVQ